MKPISKLKLQQLLDSDDVLVINVLPEKYYQERHIPGSVNIPLPGNIVFVQEVILRSTSKDQRIVVYCANEECDLSRQAAQKLKEAGFTHVQAYEEGVEGWFGEEYASWAA